MDDGNKGDFVLTDANVIANRAYLREHTVTFDPSDSGKVFRYKLKSINMIGETESIINDQLLA